MNNYIKIISAFIFSWASLICSAENVQPLWLETEHDFGVFEEELGQVTCQMRMVNRSTEPIAISNVRVSCGCTTPEYPRTPILPGDTAIVSITYDANGRPGRFSKKVYVYTDTQRKTLTISGVVIGHKSTLKSRYPISAGSLSLSDDHIFVGNLKRNKAKSVFLDAYNITTDTVIPQWIDIPSYLNIITKPQAIPPGEQVTFSFFVNASECPLWGINEAFPRLVVGNDTTSIATSVNVEEDFSKLTPGQRMKAPQIKIMSERVDFALFDRNSQQLSRQFKIKNDGQSTLHIRRLYTGVEGVTATTDKTEIKKGKEATVTVFVNPDKLPGDILNAYLTIISNDPENSQALIRIVGEFK